MAEKPTVSIIITSYSTKRLKDIFELLDSVRAQSYPQTETIFVAERSRELFDKAQAYGNEIGIPHFVVVFNDGTPGLSAARNLGAKQAKGDIVGFVDDDAVIYPDWAEQVAKIFADDDSIIGITGPALPLWETDSLTWLPKEFYWLISCTGWADWKEVREVRNAWGMNMAFRKEAFERCTGFQTAFGLRNAARTTWNDPPSEDVDFSIRVKRATGKRIMYNPKVVIKHRASKSRLTWRFIAQRSYTIGHQRRMINKLYPKANNDRAVLADETGLVKRIVTELLPATFLRLFVNPLVSLKVLALTGLSLSFAAFGYAGALLQSNDVKVTTNEA